MALDPKQARYLERFFPGLITAVEALGPGAFEPEPPKLQPLRKGLGGIGLHLTYTLSDDHVVQIRLNMQLKRGLPEYIPPPTPAPVDLADWERNYYRLHYGRRLGECLFRFDLDVSSGHHVHILPNTKLHIPSEHVEPDVCNLDPRRFIELVAVYRKQGTYPVRKKAQ